MSANASEPWWVSAAKTFGFPALVAAFLLGMIPGVNSPFDRIGKQMDAAAQAMSAHELTAREQLRVSRHICRALWKGDPVMQGACSQNGGGHQ